MSGPIQNLVISLGAMQSDLVFAFFLFLPSFLRISAQSPKPTRTRISNLDHPNRNLHYGYHTVIPPQTSGSSLYAFKPWLATPRTHGPIRCPSNCRPSSLVPLSASLSLSAGLLGSLCTPTSKSRPTCTQHAHPECPALRPHLPPQPPAPPAVARRIPFDDPQILNYVRAGYVAVQLAVLLVYYYVSTQIKKKNDLAVLKYVEPAAPMSGGEPKLVTTTVRDYDLAQASSGLKGVYTGVAMMGFMHIYMKFTQPLFIQSLMGLKGLYDSKIVQIYVLGRGGKDGKGEGYERPFKVASMFGAAAGPQTDAAAIAEAEKKIGKKDN